jgi:hypothetical protein
MHPVKDVVSFTLYLPRTDLANTPWTGPAAARLFKLRHGRQTGGGLKRYTDGTERAEAPGVVF